MHKSISKILELKKTNTKITAVTAYDYAISTICDRAGVDILLVGDSLGMVVLGYENTTQVTMEQMCLFTSAVSRARQNALIVSDLPFLSYQTSIPNAIKNAGLLIQSGADAVKLEGGASVKETIKAIVDVGIPVMGHIGLLPQTANLTQGYRVQGKTKESAMKLINDAKAVEDAGAFSMVLEMVTSDTAKIITESVLVPTIGIGAGKDCDGQVLVTHDILGMYDNVKPKFAKEYLSLSNEILGAVKSYNDDVKTSKFPTDENWFPMNAEELKKLKDEIDN